MLTLKDLATAYRQSKSSIAKKVLIYGAPSTGKTRLAGTVLKVPSIKRVFWFDFDQGILSLMQENLGYTEEELAKAVLIQPQDSVANPVAYPILKKALYSNRPSQICLHHGKDKCRTCESSGAVFKWPGMAALSPEDVLVIDSLSQVTDTTMALAKAAALQDELTTGRRNAFAKYNYLAEYLTEILSVLQACSCHVVCITHQTQETDDAGQPKGEMLPLVGSLKFSGKANKYFSDVIYTYKSSRNYRATSSHKVLSNCCASSATEFRIEEQKDSNYTLSPLFE